jgi:predicted metal-dependent HD superfamily phosphohydrolase
VEPVDTMIDIKEKRRFQYRLHLATKSFYAEPHRYYHTINHIENLVAFIGDDITIAELIAAYFHDIVYVPASPYNEEASAMMLDRYTHNTKIMLNPFSQYDYHNPQKTSDVPNVCGLSLEEIRSEIHDAKKMILATKTHRSDKHPEKYRRFLDADISILGASWDKYDLYRKGIRREYLHIPDKVYNGERALMLEGFLAHHDYKGLSFNLGDEWEKSAAYNLRAEIDILDSGE